MRTVLYIVNPTGQGGAGGGAWTSFQDRRSGAIAASQIVATERPGHAREIAATAEGPDVIVAVGGDGTVGEVMSGIMDRPEPRPALAIIPAGTGNDIARQIGIGGLQAAATALDGDATRAIDLIRVDWHDGDAARHRHGFLFGLVGFSAVPMLKPWMKRLLGPAGAYYLATFLQFLVYRAPRMTIRADDGERSGRYWMVIAGNAEWSAGGSMRLSPGARVDDGRLQICLIAAQPKPKLLARLLPRVPTGEHVHEAGVEFFPGQAITVASEPPAVLDLDGDIVGETPATFRVCPRALEVMVPAADVTPGPSAPAGG